MSALDELAAFCGILPVFYTLEGRECVTSPDTQRALLAANGIDVSSEAAIEATLAQMRHAAADRWFPEEIILTSEMQAPLEFGLGATWTLICDDNEEEVASGTPADHITLPPLPSGIYVLRASASGRTEDVTVIVAPPHLPDCAEVTNHTQLWGMTFALYGVKSARNTGLGDFADLGAMAQVAGRAGAAFVGINPIHTLGFADKVVISPYSPSHRGFLNTSYIALDAVPGVDGPFDMAAFTPMRDAQTVQYAAHKAAHNAALEQLFARFTDTAPAEHQSAFEAFCAQGGDALETFARFEAVSEIHGADWTVWPDTPTAAAPERIAFHMWLQWVADTQLAAAQKRAKDTGMPLGLYLDLAVGARRDGAESWCERDAVATGVSIGAPPDRLSPEGQNWGLAAFAPRKLRAQRYRPLRRILAQTMRRAGLIRIDHVLGLNRSFWLPDDGSPGGYIKQPFDALLAVIRIEAERHACMVIGEDLGLVPDGFRDQLRASGLYGYSVLQYEMDDQGGLPDPAYTAPQVLACFATHDTPTLAGFAAGTDIGWWESLGWCDAEAATGLRATRTRHVAAWGGKDGFAAQITGHLAHSSAAFACVQLDDLFGTLEAQNLPGTIDAHPNWRRKYPGLIEVLEAQTSLAEVADAMARAGRSHTSKGS